MENQKQTNTANEKATFTVKVGDKSYELTLEQLLANAQNQIMQTLNRPNMQGEGVKPPAKQGQNTGQLEQTSKPQFNNTTMQTPKSTASTDYAKFVREFPNVKPEQIPAEVWQEAEAEGSLVSAYRAHVIRNQKAEISGLRQMLKNKSNYVGSAASDGELAQSDPFVTALMGK